MISKVLEENRKKSIAQLNKSENDIAVHLKENYNVTVIQKMLRECIELKGKLFNRRVTEYLKICGDVDS